MTKQCSFILTRLKQSLFKYSSIHRVPITIHIIVKTQLLYYHIFAVNLAWCQCINLSRTTDGSFYS